MIGDNSYYGHAQVLRDYCSVRGRPSIPGRLQHGWTTGAGVWEPGLLEPWPKYLWARRNVELAIAGGHRHIVPVGAPFLYLPPLSLPDIPERGSNSLLVFPFHGWEKQAAEGSMRSYADAIETLAADGFGPVTVCLYWKEYEDPAARRVFEARGFDVTTNGHRDRNPTFLHKQRALIASHGAVCSNRVSTASFYALASGRPFFLHGPPAGLAGTDDPTGESYARWQLDAFPVLSYDAFTGDLHREVALRELGAEYIRTPEELRAILCWNPGGVAVRATRRVRGWLRRSPS